MKTGQEQKHNRLLQVSKKEERRKKERMKQENNFIYIVDSIR